MSRRVATALAASAIFVSAILFADGAGLPRQLLLGLLTAAALWLVATKVEVDPRQILVAIAVATTGEVVLSVVLGLYDYRFATIPLYVPPGHGLFYALAAATAREPWLRARSRAIVRAVILAGSVIATGALVLAGDAWGALWWIAAALLIARSSNALLLSVCCSYTMLLEWLGTSMGNWAWAPEVLGLRSGNPPSGVGILYIVLDLATVAICASWGSWSHIPRPSVQHTRRQDAVIPSAARNLQEEF